MSTASIQRSSVPKPPFWGKNAVEKHCHYINIMGGQREIKYEEILAFFKPAVKSITSLDEIKTIYRNFVIIVNMMPEEIRKRPMIECRFHTLNYRVKEAYCEQLAAVLQTIENGLIQSYRGSLLQEISLQLDLIEKDLPEDIRLDFAENIETCKKLYWDAMRKTCLAPPHQHQVNMQE